MLPLVLQSWRCLCCNRTVNVDITFRRTLRTSLFRFRYNPKLLHKTGETLLQRDDEKTKRRREANARYVQEMKDKFKRCAEAALI